MHPMVVHTRMAPKEVSNVGTTGGGPSVKADRGEKLERVSMVCTRRDLGILEGLPWMIKYDRRTELEECTLQ